MKTLSAAAVALLAAVSLAACATQTAAPKPTPKPFTAEGTVSVPMNLSATLPLQDGKPTIGNPCIPDDGYSDISDGAQVVVSDASGKKIAIGELESTGLANGQGTTAFASSVCEFRFTVSDVPNVSKIYSVHVGNTARGDVSYSRAELKDGVALTIGG